MGCASSKIDDLPAVLLCRERLQHLSQALHHRYSLAEAHLSYIHSLQSLGHSLHRFFDTAASLPPPPLNLPSHRKIANDNSGHLSSSHSNSGSHLNFHSDSEDDDEEHLHDHGSGSESGSGHLDLYNELEGPTIGGKMVYEESGFGGGGGSGFGLGMGFNPYLYSSNNNGYTINYMRKHGTPSLSYEQKPVSYDTQTVQFGDHSSTSNSNYYDYFVANNNGNDNGDMSSYGPYGGLAYFEGAQRGGGGWNSGMPPQQTGPTKQQAAPPPPPPPATSSWDFMNLFESIEDNHYPTYRNRTPSSRDSREMREDEGIPELEDEDYAHEVVKEVHGHQKLVVDEGGSSGKSSSSSSSSSISSGGGEGKGGGEVKRREVVEEEAVGVSEVESGNVHIERPSASIEGAPVAYEVKMVDKNVVGEDGKGDGGRKGGSDGGRPGFRNVLEVVKEIQVQFERAANSGGELGNVLEVGNLRYQRKNAAYQG